MPPKTKGKHLVALKGKQLVAFKGKQIVPSKGKEIVLCKGKKLVLLDGNKRSVRKKEATEGTVKKNSKPPPGGEFFPQLRHLNHFYINNVPPGMLVACDKCNKWRHVKEYQETWDVPEYFDCSMWHISDDEKGNCYIPQLEDESIYTNELYTPGSMVWVKMIGYEWWPAMVEDDPTQLDITKLLYCKDLDKNPQYHVVFFGEKVSRSWIGEKQIRPFSVAEAIDKLPKNLKHRKAIEDAVEAMKMKKDVRLLTYSFAERYRKNSVKNENNGSTSPSRDGPANQRASKEPSRRKRTSNDESVATAKRTRRSPRHSLAQMTESEKPHIKMDTQEDKNSRVNGEEVPKNTKYFITDENNNDKRRGSKNKRKSVELQGSPANTFEDSDNEDDLRSKEEKLYSEFVNKYYPSFTMFKWRAFVSYEDAKAEADKLYENFLKQRKTAIPLRF